MGKKRSIKKSQTLPPSPSHSFSSSSSSDFEFTISVSARNNKACCEQSLCPADELFYKGQLLPLHLSPRLSMVRTLLLASSSTSSASRSSTGRSSTDSHSSFNSELVLLPDSCDSSRRPSSVAADDHNNNNNNSNHVKPSSSSSFSSSGSRSESNNFRYFSLPKFASVFKRDPTCKRSETGGNSSKVKEVIRKYLKKVKPLYEKISISQKNQNHNRQPESTTQKLGRLMMMTVPESTATRNIERSVKPVHKKSVNAFSNSFSGNLRYPRRKSSISSCPSSIRSSPSHSGVLCRPGKGMFQNNNSNNNISLEKSTSSSMEELQSAIQGAIAHCKNSLITHQ